MKKIVLSLSLALFSLSAFAAEQAEDPCTVQGGGVWAGYLCVEQAMKVADKALNTSYQAALSRIKVEEALLKETDRKSVV